MLSLTTPAIAADAPAQEILGWALREFPRDRIALSTSFQLEGMVILDMAWRIDPLVQVFTIDTGRLPVHMIEAARAGRFVVRLKGGDPFVFGRGGEEVLALAAAGITIEVVPGVSSATAAPALAGIPLTHRRLAASFAVTTARRADGGVHDFRGLAGADTLVVMMPVQALQQVSAELIAAGWSRTCPVALVEAASTSRQRVVRARLDDIGRRAGRRPVEGPALLVVGAVVNALAGATASDQSVQDGVPRGGDSGAYPQLRVDGAKVGVDGAPADGELGRNLWIAQTTGHQG